MPAKKVLITLQEDVLALVDDRANARGMNRSAYLAACALGLIGSAGSDAPDEEMDAFTFHWKEAARRLAREMGVLDLAADAYPGQVIDAALVADRNTVDAMRRFARIVAANTKHGPNGGGERGACDPGCVKCHAERVLSAASVQMVCSGCGQPVEGGTDYVLPAEHVCPPGTFDKARRE